MKRVLVLSGDSYVGRHVVQLFHNSGEYEVDVTLSHKPHGLAAVSHLCHRASPTDDTELSARLDSSDPSATAQTAPSVPLELQGCVQNLVPNYVSAPYDFTREVVSYDVIVGVLDENDDEDNHNISKDTVDANTSDTTKKSSLNHDDATDKGGVSHDARIDGNVASSNSHTNTPSTARVKGDGVTAVDSVFEAESAIRALQNTHFSVEKTFVLVSSVLTWADTARQECAQQRRAQREARARQRAAFYEEFGSDAELPDELREDDDDDTMTQSKQSGSRVHTATDHHSSRSNHTSDNRGSHPGTTSQDDNNQHRDNKDDEDDEEDAVVMVEADDVSVGFETEMRAMQRVYTESQYAQRVPHPRYHRWRQLERMVKRANSATVHTYVIAAGLAYGGLYRGGLLDEMLVSAWSGGVLPQYGLGDNTLAMVHVCDLAKLVYRIGGAYDILPERYLLAVDRGRITVRQLMQAVRRGVGGHVVRLSSFEERVTEVQKEWGGLDSDHDGGNTAVVGSNSSAAAPSESSRYAYADDEEDVDAAREMALREATLRRLRDSYAAYRSRQRMPNTKLYESADASNNDSDKDTKKSNKESMATTDHLHDTRTGEDTILSPALAAHLLSDVTLEPEEALSYCDAELWTALDGFVAHIHTVAYEFTHTHQRCPIRRVITGPPLSGAADIAAVMACTLGGAQLLTAESAARDFVHHVRLRLRPALHGLLLRRLMRRYERMHARQVKALLAMLRRRAARRRRANEDDNDDEGERGGRREKDDDDDAHPHDEDDNHDSDNHNHKSSNNNNNNNNSKHPFGRNAVYDYDASDETDDEDGFHIVRDDEDENEDEDADGEEKHAAQGERRASATAEATDKSESDAESETEEPAVDGHADDQAGTRNSHRHGGKIAVRITTDPQTGVTSYLFANDRHRDVAAAAARLTEHHLRGLGAESDAESDAESEDAGRRVSADDADVRAIEESESEEDDDEEDEDDYEDEYDEDAYDDDRREDHRHGGVRGRAKRALWAAVRKARDVRERIRISVLRQEYTLALRVLALRTASPSSSSSSDTGAKRQPNSSATPARMNDSASEDDDEGEEDESSEDEEGDTTTPNHHQLRHSSRANRAAYLSAPRPHFADVALAFMLRWRLRQPDCRNQGFVLTGFPQTVQQACMLFYEDDAEVEEGHRDSLGDAEVWRRAAVENHILPPRHGDAIPPPCDATFPLPPAHRGGAWDSHAQHPPFPVFADAASSSSPGKEAEYSRDSEGRIPRLRRVKECIFPDDVVFLQAPDRVLRGIANVYAHVVQSVSLTGSPALEQRASADSTEAEEGAEDSMLPSSAKGTMMIMGSNTRQADSSVQRSEAVVGCGAGRAGALGTEETKVENNTRNDVRRRGRDDDNAADAPHTQVAHQRYEDEKEEDKRGKPTQSVSTSASAAASAVAGSSMTSSHGTASLSPSELNALPFVRGVADFHRRLAHYRHHHREGASPAESLLTWYMTVETNRVPGWTTAYLYAAPLPSGEEEEEDDEDEDEDEINDGRLGGMRREKSGGGGGGAYGGETSEAMDGAEAWRTARVILLAAPVPQPAAMQRIGRVCVRRQQRRRAAAQKALLDTYAAAKWAKRANRHHNEKSHRRHRRDDRGADHQDEGVSELDRLATQMEDGEDALTAPCGVVDVGVHNFACDLTARLSHPNSAVSDASMSKEVASSSTPPPAPPPAAAAASAARAANTNAATGSEITTMMRDGGLGALSQPPPSAAVLKEAEKLSRLLREERVLSAEAANQNQANIQHERHVLRFMQIQECSNSDPRMETMTMQEYLMEYVLPSLTPAITRVAELRPEDPVTVLADLLFNSKRQTEL